MLSSLYRYYYDQRPLFPVAATYEKALYELLGLDPLEEGDTFQCQLREDLVFAQPNRQTAVETFQKAYMSLIEARFPTLRPQEARFVQYLAFVDSLGLGIEDYSVDLVFENNSFLIQMDRLHGQIKFCEDDEHRLWMANLVLDMVMSASLVPSSIIFVPGKHDVTLHFDYDGDVRRHWIQGLPMDLVQEVCKELRLGCRSPGGFESSILLHHVNVEKYREMGVAQRIAHLSLSNFHGSMRKIALEDKLVIQVVASPQLPLWMLTCSNMDEQYWLNTCEVAARNNMIALRLPTVAHCIVFTREICRHLTEWIIPKLSKSKPWSKSLWGYCCFSLPSVQAYATSVVERVELELDDLVRRGELLLQLESEPFSERLELSLQRLVLDWNRVTQLLSTIYYPDEPTVLSWKLFPGQWQLSAKSIAVPCILGSLLPGQPLVVSRNEGTQGEYFRASSYFIWQDKLSKIRSSEFCDLAARILEMSREDRDEILNQLWELALNYGGVFFGSRESIFGQDVGHLNGLFAIRMPKTGRHFLICDPEISRFKWTNFDQMAVLIGSPKVKFDLFNV